MHPLTQARERLDFTQQQLADFIPISLSTIQRAEAGQRISSYSRGKICEFFSEKYHRCIESSELGLVHEKGRDRNEELYITKKDILVKDTESDNQMKRRDLFRGLAAASFTTVTTLHEIPELLQSMDLISVVIARYPRDTRKILLEAEALTNHYCQYLPFVADVVDDSSLVFICGHLQMLLSLLRRSPHSSMDTHLYNFSSQTAQVAGLLLHSLKHHDEAETLYLCAVEYAQRADNDALQAVALGRIGNFWIDTYRANRALDPLEAASLLAKGSAPATVRSWIAASEAEALANIGQASACDRALGIAEDLASQMVSDQDPYYTPFDHPWLNGYKGSCYGRLGRTHDARNAQAVLKQALEHLSPTCIFRRSSLLRDLAIAYSLDKNIEEACYAANQAVKMAEQANAPMELQHIQIFSRRYLSTWKDNRAVKDLNDHVWAAQKKFE